MSSAQVGLVRPYNLLAVVGFIVAFVVPPGGIVCCTIARRQLRTSSAQGEGLALAGLIIGIVLTAVIALFVLVWLAAMVVFFVAWFSALAQLPR